MSEERRPADPREKIEITPHAERRRRSADFILQQLDDLKSDPKEAMGKAKDSGFLSEDEGVIVPMGALGTEIYDAYQHRLAEDREREDTKRKQQEEEEAQEILGESPEVIPPDQPGEPIESKESKEDESTEPDDGRDKVTDSADSRFADDENNGEPEYTQVRPEGTEPDPIAERYEREARIAAEIAERKQAQAKEEMADIEKALTYEQRAQEAMAKNGISEAINGRILELQKVERPISRNIFEKAYWMIFDSKKLDEYREGVKTHKDAQEKIKEIERLESDWARREAKIIAQAEKIKPRLTELITIQNERKLSRREQKELDKLTSKLVIMRIGIDNDFLSMVAEKAGVSYTPPVRKFEGLPDTEDFDQKEKDQKKAYIEKIKSEPELYKLFMSLTPEYQDLFLKEQSGESLREVAMALVRRDGAINEAERLLESGDFISDPNQLHQLIGLLDQSVHNTIAAEAALKGQFRTYAFRQSTDELLKVIETRLKRTLAKAVATDQGIEIDFDTSAREIILNGNNQLAEAINGTVELGDMARLGYNRTIWAGRMAQRLSHRGMDKFIRVRKGYLTREKELSGQIADLDASADEIRDVLDQVRGRSTRPKSRGTRMKEYVEGLIPEGTTDENVRRSITAQMIEGIVRETELIYQNPEDQAITKTKRTELMDQFKKEGFSSSFGENLYDFLEGLIESINAERAIIDTELEQIEAQKRTLEQELDTDEENASDEISTGQEAQRDAEEADLRTRERLLEARLASIQRSVRLQLTALEGRVEKQIIKSLRDAIK